MLGHFLAFWFPSFKSRELLTPLWHFGADLQHQLRGAHIAHLEVPAQLMAVWFDATATLLDSLQRMDTLQGINISHLGKRKIIFKMPFLVEYVSFLEGILEDVEGVKIINSERVGLGGWFWLMLPSFPCRKNVHQKNGGCQQLTRNEKGGLRYWTRSQVHP